MGECDGFEYMLWLCAWNEKKLNEIDTIAAHIMMMALQQIHALK